MIRTAIAAVVLWLGGALAVSDTRWARRTRIGDRLRDHLPGHARTATLPIARDLVIPIAQRWSARVSRIAGVHEEAAVRLERIHDDRDVGEWRLRQLTFTMLSFLASAAFVTAMRPPPLVAMLFVVGGPAIAFLVVEQQLASASTRWQRGLLLELPVVAEQLAMLLNAGYSVGAAVDRIADRGRGVIAEDLRRVTARVRHGVSEHRALHEWAELSGVPAVDRLVDVLALDRDAGDLGRLVSLEARAVRREVHRDLVELMERRAQQVWIPVTVAALVPGVIFIAVPFVAAMELFASS